MATNPPLGHARCYCDYCGRERPMKFIPEPPCAGCGAPVVVSLKKWFPDTVEHTSTVNGVRVVTQVLKL